MEYIVKSRLHRSVKCALLLFDDYTDRPILGQQVNIFISENPTVKAIRKSDGYFVIVSEDDKLDKIMITVNGYVNKTIKISDYQLQSLNPVIKVRMNPSCSYGIKAGTSALTGRTYPNADILLKFVNPDEKIKLLTDYDCKSSENDKVMIFCGYIDSMEEKEFFISDKKSKDKEIFKIAEKCDENKYVIYKCLGKNYKKNDTSIDVIFKGRSDENGRYMLPLRYVGEDGNCDILVTMQDHTEKHFQSQVIKGKITTANFI